MSTSAEISIVTGYLHNVLLLLCLLVLVCKHGSEYVGQKAHNLPQRLRLSLYVELPEEENSGRSRWESVIELHVVTLQPGCFDLCEEMMQWEEFLIEVDWQSFVYGSNCMRRATTRVLWYDQYRCLTARGAISLGAPYEPRCLHR